MSQTKATVNTYIYETGHQSCTSANKTCQGNIACVEDLHLSHLKITIYTPCIHPIFKIWNVKRLNIVLVYNLLAKWS